MALVFFISGCSVAVLRPTQEMAIADSALRAAREVNADAIEGTSIPEIYRAAADNLFKAKREYRLKNFDRAKRYAIKATLLAERAEFEAIKSGGATPEATAARENTTMEGAESDPNLGLDQSINAGAPPIPENLNDAPPSAKPVDAKVEPEELGGLAELQGGEQKAAPDDKAGADAKKPATPKPE